MTRCCPQATTLTGPTQSCSQSNADAREPLHSLPPAHKMQAPGIKLQMLPYMIILLFIPLFVCSPVIHKNRSHCDARVCSRIMDFLVLPPMTVIVGPCSRGTAHDTPQFARALPDETMDNTTDQLLTKILHHLNMVTTLKMFLSVPNTGVDVIHVSTLGLQYAMMVSPVVSNSSTLVPNVPALSFDHTMGLCTTDDADGYSNSTHYDLLQLHVQFAHRSDTCLLYFTCLSDVPQQTYICHHVTRTPGVPDTRLSTKYLQPTCSPEEWPPTTAYNCWPNKLQHLQDEEAPFHSKKTP